MPVLHDTFEQIKTVVHDVLPIKKRRTVLEEAEWEDEDDGTFEKEMMLQCRWPSPCSQRNWDVPHRGSLAPFCTAFETMQLYRPRVLIHGERGMGQRVLGSAVLHYLEGYHVQNLDLASLLGQSNGVSDVEPLFRS